MAATRPGAVQAIGPPGAGRPGTSTPPPHGQTLYSQTTEALDCMLQSFITQSPTAEELHFLLSVRLAGQRGSGGNVLRPGLGGPRRAAQRKQGLDGGSSHTRHHSGGEGGAAGGARGEVWCGSAPPGPFPCSSDPGLSLWLSPWLALQESCRVRRETITGQ